MSVERYLAHLTWTDIDQLEKEDGVVVLPIGAVEQHGPHLPTLTDALIAGHLLDAALDRLPSDVPVWALPPLNYGKSNEHVGFPGTVTLSTSTLIAIVHEIAQSVSSAGFRRLAFFNGHGGNVPVLEAAARDIRAKLGLMCFCLQPAIYMDPPFEIAEAEERLGFHAGELETSLVLAIAPELVQMERAVTHYADFPHSDTSLFFFGSASTAWLSKDWSDSGVFGDATRGTEEKGRALIDAMADKVARLLAVISTFEVHEDSSQGSDGQGWDGER